MKNVTAYIILALFALVPVITSAENDPLEVDFNPDPLFQEAGGFLPGDTSSGSFETTNNTDSDQDLYIRFLEKSQTHNLAQAIIVSVSHTSGSEVEAQTLDEWFSDGNVFLVNLGAGGETTFDAHALFEQTSGNAYQNGYVDFDVCVGFSGGEEVCMDDSNDEDREISTNTPRSQFESDQDENDEGDGGGEEGQGGSETITPLNTPDIPEGSLTSTGGEGGGEEIVQDTGETSGDIQLNGLEDDEDEEIDEETERETQAAAAFLGLPGSLEEAVMCISYFLLILLLIVLLTIPFDSIRNAERLSRHDRVTGRIVFVTFLALVATALALVIPALHCTFLALLITTVLGVLWFGYEDRRLVSEYY